MAEKHTKRELFESLLVFASAAEAEGWVLDGIQHELDLLAKRAADKAPNAAKAAEQREIQDKIVTVLSNATDRMRAGEIANAMADGTAVQRVTALIKPLVADGTVRRVDEKKIAYFTLA